MISRLQHCFRLLDLGGIMVDRLSEQKAPKKRNNTPNLTPAESSHLAKLTHGDALAWEHDVTNVISDVTAQDFTTK